VTSSMFSPLERLDYTIHHHFAGDMS